VVEYQHRSTAGQQDGADKPTNYKSYSTIHQFNGEQTLEHNAEMSFVRKESMLPIGGIVTPVSDTQKRSTPEEPTRHSGGNCKIA